MCVCFSILPSHPRLRQRPAVAFAALGGLPVLAPAPRCAAAAGSSATWDDVKDLQPLQPKKV